MIGNPEMSNSKKLVAVKWKEEIASWRPGSGAFW